MNPYLNFEETEIDLLDLIRYLLRKVVWILLAGVICAGIAGSYRYVKLKRAGSNQEAVMQAETEYELDLERYERQSELIDASDVNTLDLIRRQEEYLQNSILMNLDPYHVWRDVIVVRIASKESESHAYQYREFYRNELLNADYLQNLAKERGTDPGYLNELINVINADGVYGISTNNSDNSNNSNNSNNSGLLVPVEDVENPSSSSVFSVTTYGNSKEEALGLMDVVVEKLEDVQERYTKTLPHEMSILSRACSESVDTYIRQCQRDTLTFTQNLTYQMKDNVDKAALLKKPAETAKPAAGGISKRSLLKYGLVGFVIGAFLMCLWYGLRYLFNDKLSDYKGMEQKGLILKQLGCISDQGIAMVAANIRNFAGENKRLFLTGMSEPAQFEAASSGLKEYLTDYEVVFARDLLHDPKTRELLLNCDAAVLVEQKGVTHYSDMIEEVTFFYNAGKEIIGAVIL